MFADRAVDQTTVTQTYNSLIGDAIRIAYHEAHWISAQIDKVFLFLLWLTKVQIYQYHKCWPLLKASSVSNVDSLLDLKVDDGTASGLYLAFQGMIAKNEIPVSNIICIALMF